MNEIIRLYKEWKLQHPDEDYQYDEIHDFVSQLGRGDLQAVFEFIEKKLSHE